MATKKNQNFYSEKEIVKQELITKSSLEYLNGGIKTERRVLCVKSFYKNGTAKTRPVATLKKSVKGQWLWTQKNISDDELKKLGFVGIKNLK